MAKTLSQEEKAAAVKEMGEWCLTILDFQKAGFLPELFQKAQDAVARTMAAQNLRGMRMIAHDMAEMGQSGTRAQTAELDALLRRKHGRGFAEVKKERQREAALILARGKIRTEDEYRVLQDRIEDLVDEEADAVEIENIDSLMATYVP